MTNLPAGRFPPPLLRELYHKRRGIETSFSFFAEETPRFCPALFSDAYVYVTASELLSRRRLSWGGYLNEITAWPEGFVVSARRRFRHGPCRGESALPVSYQICPSGPV